MNINNLSYNKIDIPLMKLKLFSWECISHPQAFPSGKLIRDYE